MKRDLNFFKTVGYMNSKVASNNKEISSKRFLNNMELAIAQRKFGYFASTETTALTVTALNSTTEQITITGHGLVEDEAVIVNSTDNGITVNVRYYVNVVDANTIKLKYSPQASGSAEFVDITGTTAGQFFYRATDNTFLLVGDSNVENSNVLLIQNSWANQLQIAINTRQFDSAIVEFLQYPSGAVATGSTTYVTLGDNAEWDDVQNIYSSVGKDMSEVASTGLANRGWCKTNTTTETLTINTEVGGQLYDVRILVASDGVFDGETAGSFTAQLDSGATETWDCSGETLYKWIYPNMNGNTTSSTLTLTASLGGSEYFAVLAIEYLNPAQNQGCKVINFATAGSAAAHWVERQNVIAAFNPTTILMGLGGNDIALSQTDAQYRANMETLIEEYQTYGELVLIFYSPWYGAGATAAVLALVDEYRNTCYALSRKYNLKYIDFHDVIIDGDYMNDNGLFGDTEATKVHANDKGHEFMFKYLTNKINIS